jgi:histone H3/H4
MKATAAPRSHSKKLEKRIPTSLPTKRQNRPRTTEMQTYIGRIMKQNSNTQGVGLSVNASGIVEECMNDAFGRVVDKAALIVRYAKRSTLQTRHLRAAVLAIFPYDLAEAADEFGRAAVKRYQTKGGE